MSATPHRRRDHISCGHLRGFGFLNQFCLPREVGTQGQERFRRKAARCSVGMVLRCHSSARFPYRLLFILGFCLFLPTSEVRLLFYSLVLLYFLFMPLSVFTYFRTAYFLLHFLSPFLVLRLPASFSVFCCIHFFIVCVFSVFLSVPVLSVDSSCLCLSSFPRLFCFLMLSDVCIGTRRCVPTFISKNWSKPQKVRFWSPL